MSIKLERKCKHGWSPVAYLCDLAEVDWLFAFGHNPLFRVIDEWGEVLR